MMGSSCFEALEGATKPASFTSEGSPLPSLGFGDWSNLDAISAEQRAALKQVYLSADPFPHLVIDALFDARLLTEIERDFDVMHLDNWRESRHPLQRKQGTAPGIALPRASSHYFEQLAAVPMRRFLSSITGIENLRADPLLVNGGLHQVPNGGSFELHVDFPFHPESRLKTRLVVITYLNYGWLNEWDGALEMWNWKPRERRVTILPEFGRTVIMEVGPHNVHGHPLAVNTPDGRLRRSAAGYFYTDPIPEEQIADVTVYVDRPGASLFQRAIRLAHTAMPSGLARHARQIISKQ